MSWLHLTDRYIQRTKGGNAIAAAAYCDTAAYADERTGRTYAYGASTSKSGTITKAMHKRANTIRLGTILGDGTSYDTASLWNTIEKREPKNGQPGRTLEAAFPIGMTADQRIEAAKEFAAYLATDGSAVTCAIHMDNPDNPHLHIVKSGKPVTLASDGTLILGKKPRIAMGERAKIIMAEREAFAAICNKHLPPETQISPYSYQAQGIDKTPGKHIGPAASRMIQRGEYSARADYCATHTEQAQAEATLAQAEAEIEAINTAIAAQATRSINHADIDTGRNQTSADAPHSKPRPEAQHYDPDRGTHSERTGRLQNETGRGNTRTERTHKQNAGERYSDTKRSHNADHDSPQRACAPAGRRTPGEERGLNRDRGTPGRSGKQSRGAGIGAAFVKSALTLKDIAHRLADDVTAIAERTDLETIRSKNHDKRDRLHNPHRRTVTQSQKAR